MVLLDLLLFLLPYPVLFAITLVALPSVGIPLSDPFKRTLRNTIALYAALIAVAYLSGSPVVTLLTGPMTVIIVFLVGRDVLAHHQDHRPARNLLWSTAALLIAIPLLSSIVTFTSTTAPLLWVANALAWGTLAHLWLTRTSISDRNLARLVASAMHVVSVTLVALAFLWFF